MRQSGWHKRKKPTGSGQQLPSGLHSNTQFTGVQIGSGKRVLHIGYKMSEFACTGVAGADDGPAAGFRTVPTGQQLAAQTGWQQRLYYFQSCLRCCQASAQALQRAAFLAGLLYGLGFAGAVLVHGQCTGVQ